MRLWLVIALAGCVPHGSSGPAWPKQHETEHDGGESIAPHEGAKAIAAAVEEEAKPTEKPAAVPEVKPTVEKPAAEKPAEKPVAEKPEDPMMTEEIIIEVED
jgi:hypothetical protein